MRPMGVGVAVARSEVLGVSEATLCLFFFDPEAAVLARQPKRVECMLESGIACLQDRTTMRHT